MPILISLILTILFSWLWAEGIDSMAKKHPDYKGDDFLELPKNIYGKPDRRSN